MTDHEKRIEALVAQWRSQDTLASQAADEADQTKQEIIRLMQEVGLKTHDSHLGKMTITKSTKTNIVVKRKEFEATLKRHGIYDRFCSTKFDMSLVKDYVEREGDDLYGMVEVEETYSTRFTPRTIIGE